MNESKFLSLIPMEKRIEIIRKNWMSHDARWQYAVFQELGIEKGNRFNLEIIREMGKVMIFRVMNALGISQISNHDEFELVWKTAMYLYWPSPLYVYTLQRIEGSIYRVSVTRCLTSENVQKVGIAQDYECGCSSMRAGWFEALGVEADQQVEKCLKNNDDTCEIRWCIKEFSNGREKKELNQLM